MWFEQVKEWITWFCNLPLPIAGITVGTAGVFLLILFSKTSLGKRLFNKLLEKFEILKSWVIEQLSGMNKRIDELKNQYEEKLQIANHKTEQVEKLVLDVLPFIHNAQVQEKVTEYLEKGKEIVAIADVVDDKVIQAKEQAIKEADAIIQEYKNKLTAQFEQEKEKYLAEFDTKQAEWKAEIEKYKEIAESKTNEAVNSVEEKVEEIEESVNEKVDEAVEVIEHVETEISEIRKE